MQGCQETPSKVICLRPLPLKKLNFYFEVIVNSLAVIRNNTERSHMPFPQFPPGEHFTAL